MAYSNFSCGAFHKDLLDMNLYLVTLFSYKIQEESTQKISTPFSYIVGLGDCGVFVLSVWKWLGGGHTSHCLLIHNTGIPL